MEKANQIGNFYVGSKDGYFKPENMKILGAIKSNFNIDKRDVNNSRILNMFENGNLRVTPESKDTRTITLVNAKYDFARAPKDIEYAHCFFRAMTTDEYNEFENTGLLKESSYTGISPDYTYCQNYLSENRPGVIVMFSGNNTDSYIKDLAKDTKAQAKAENGAMSYGLGATGGNPAFSTGFRRALADKDIEVTIAAVVCAKTPGKDYGL